MSLFPRITSPCPYIDRLDTVVDGDHCRMCQRHVYDLTHMDDGERAAFLAACNGDACVSYVAMVRPAVAAALVAMAAAALVAPDAALAHKAKPKTAKVRNVPPTYVPIVLGGAPVPIPMPPHQPPIPVK